MALTYEGNLGIGITNPTDRLSVQGTSLFTGAATFNDNVTISGTLSVEIYLNITVTCSILGLLLNCEEQLLTNVNTASVFQPQ